MPILNTHSNVGQKAKKVLLVVFISPVHTDHEEITCLSSVEKCIQMCV